MIKSIYAVSLVGFLYCFELQAQTSVLQKACMSSDPVLIYDNFPTPASKRSIIDLDGDLVPDISHGEYVETIVRFSGHQTVRLNLFGEVLLEDIEINLARTVKDIETGAAKYSRINFSQELPLKISSFKMDLFFDDSSVPDINAENIAQYKDKILEKLWTERPDFKLQELYQHFLNLQKLGVPMIAAAGNNGPNYVNLFSLFPGVISVGALDLDGTKRVVSADNALVTQWRTGSFVSQNLSGGIDINADNIIDFNQDLLSQQQKIVDLFLGQKASEVVMTVDSEYVEWTKQLAQSPHVVPNAALNALKVGLYRVADLVDLGTVTPGTKRHFLKSGTLVYKGEFGPPAFFFTENKDGVVTFDPLNSGALNQVMMISGTSFAAPDICKGL